MVVGHIYRAFGGGGMQRGTGAILSAQHAMGHKLVVFTREPRGEGDYEIDVPFRHVLLPGGSIRKGASPERAAQLQAAVAETGCDIVVHHEYYARFALDDLRILREMGVPTLVQWHSCFSALNMLKPWDGRVLGQIEGVVALSGGILTLSRTDEAFFRMLGARAMHIPYSDPDMFEQVPVHGDGHRLLWTGRMVPNKRPIDAVKILERVLERFPDATLTMLGDGKSRGELGRYVASRPALAGHVSLPGFINDVAPYLRESDVFLVTTSFEGFMHSLVEAKMAALPVVGYRMDYLDTARPGTGYCAVPQGDFAAAAEEVCRLFADPAERHRLGALARSDFEGFLKLDQQRLYSEAFEMAMRPQEAPAAGGPEADVVRVLMEHVDLHLQRRLGEWEEVARRSRDKLRRRREKLRRCRERLRRCKKKLRDRGKKLRKLRASKTYRLGHMLTWPLRLLKRIRRRLAP